MLDGESRRGKYNIHTQCCLHPSLDQRDCRSRYRSQRTKSRLKQTSQLFVSLQARYDDPF